MRNIPEMVGMMAELEGGRRVFFALNRNSYLRVCVKRLLILVEEHREFPYPLLWLRVCADDIQAAAFYNSLVFMDMVAFRPLVI